MSGFCTYVIAGVEATNFFATATLYVLSSEIFRTNSVSANEGQSTFILTPLVHTVSFIFKKNKMYM